MDSWISQEREFISEAVRLREASSQTEQPPLVEFAFFIEVHLIQGEGIHEGGGVFRIFPGNGVEISQSSADHFVSLYGLHF